MKQIVSWPRFQSVKWKGFSNASFSFFLKEIITQVCSNNTDLEPAVHSWATGAASSPLCVFRTAYVDPKIVSHWFLRLLRSVEKTRFEATQPVSSASTFLELYHHSFVALKSNFYWVSRQLFSPQTLNKIGQKGTKSRFFCAYCRSVYFL